MYNETPGVGQWNDPTPSRAIGETPTRRPHSSWDVKTPLIGMTPSQGFTPTPNQLINQTPSPYSL